MTDDGQKPDDGGQMTDDGQKPDDGGQMTEDRRRTAEPQKIEHGASEVRDLFHLGDVVEFVELLFNEARAL